MQDTPQHPEADPRETFRDTISRKETRRLKSQREGKRSVWFGMGMFGLVGWAVAVPMVLGILVGVWVDRRWPSRLSWTLMFLFIGVVLGCLHAWYWVQRESRGGNGW